MKNTKLQALIASALGDGCLRKQCKNGNAHLQFSSIHRENCAFRNRMLETNSKITKNRNNGYKQSWIYKFRTPADRDVTRVYNMSLKELLDNIDKLGVAMWFYDDGSLHKSKLFYNLNTHSFSKEEHIEYIIPFFRGIGLNPILRKDKTYWCVTFNKRDNAVWISDLLAEFYISEMDYKIYPSTSFLKGFQYKNNYFISLHDISTVLNLSRNNVLQLLNYRKEIKRINYLDVQRLSKPGFWE